MDVEDIHMFRDGQFTVVEEYSPSLAILNEHGKVLIRYTPQGKTLSGAAYPVSDRLPAILSQRRSNRGFESVAISKDERTAYIMTQSPLGPTGSGTPTRNSRVVRAIRLDITDRLNAQVTAQFVILMSPAADYKTGNRQQDLKISSAVCLDQDRLLLIERSDEVGIGGAKLVLVDLSGASDVSTLPIAQTLALEDSSLNLASLGIIPATSTVVFHNEETPELTDFKLEGLAVLNQNDVAISNDNDFGIDAPVNFQTWVIRLGDRLP
jgi:alkaline phosphatase